MGLLALLLAAAAAALPLTAPPRKKHHAAASHSSTSAHKIAPAAKGAQTTSRLRARVHYSVPVNPMRKAALVEEIGARLKEPAPHAITYGNALDGFYAQLASHENAQHDSAIQTAQCA